MLKKLLLLLCCSCVLSVQAQYVQIEQATIEAYISSLPDVDALGQRVEASGQVDQWFVELVPMPGMPFNPHQQAVERIAQYAPAYHAELNKIVIGYGFTSVQRWAEMGDRVLLAYAAVKAEQENPTLWQLASQEYTQVPAEMVRMLPENLKDEVNQALTITRALVLAPRADRYAIAPYMTQLDTALPR
ncbi:MAG: hypothetical protein ACK4L8_02200 [Nitrincola lacisaponensis]|uniref:hypothetical protein n=1 Tax=Nitrincola lacisaponensis TaxID=267850 RepID=UPI00391B44E9